MDKGSKAIIIGLVAAAVLSGYALRMVENLTSKINTNVGMQVNMEEEQTAPAVMNGIGSPNISSTIVISGNVDTLDHEMRPVEITFVDSNVGNKYGNLVNDHQFYEVGLPNGDHNYDVIVRWQGSAGSGGTCDAGSLGYDTPSPPFLFRDYQC
jgi:hypothetical protein